MKLCQTVVLTLLVVAGASGNGAHPVAGDVLQFVGSQPEREEMILKQAALNVGIIAPAARKLTWRFSHKELGRHEEVAANG